MLISKQVSSIALGPHTRFIFEEASAYGQVETSKQERKKREERKKEKERIPSNNNSHARPFFMYAWHHGHCLLLTTVTTSTPFLLSFFLYLFSFFLSFFPSFSLFFPSFLLQQQRRRKGEKRRNNVTPKNERFLFCLQPVSADKMRSFFFCLLDKQTLLFGHIFFFFFCEPSSFPSSFPFSRNFFPVETDS